MWAVVVAVCGVVVVIVTTRRSAWRSVERWIDAYTEVESPITTRVWAKRLDEDEREVRDVAKRVIRVFWFLVGVAMVIGSVVFLAQHGFSGS